MSSATLKITPKNQHMQESADCLIPHPAVFNSFQYFQAIYYQLQFLLSCIHTFASSAIPCTQPLQSNTVHIHGRSLMTITLVHLIYESYTERWAAESQAVGRGFRGGNNKMAQSPYGTNSNSWKFDFIFARGASKHPGARSGGSDLVPCNVSARHGTHTFS